MSIPSKKPIVVIALVTAVCMLGNEMLFIVLPLHWHFFGLESLWQVGILLSVNRLIRIPMNSVVAYFYRNVGKRTGILIAVILAVTSTFAYGVAKGFWLLLLVRCLWGIAWSFFRLGGYLTVISCSSANTRGQNIGLYNGLWGMGTLFGMLFGGLLTDLIGIYTVTTLFAVIGMLSIPFAIYYVPNTKDTTTNKQHGKKTHPNIWKDKKNVSSFATGLLTAFIIFGVFASTLSKLTEFQINHPLTLLGFSIGAGSITGIIQAIRTGWEPFLAPFIGKWSDQKWGRIPLLIIALFIAFFCFILLPLKMPLFIFLFVVMFFQLTTTMLITMSDSIATDQVSGTEHVKIIAYYTLFVDIGSALGPLLGYVIMDVLGILWIYWLSSILILPLVFYWIYVYKKEKSFQNRTINE